MLTSRARDETSGLDRPLVLRASEQILAGAARFGALSGTIQFIAITCILIGIGAITVYIGAVPTRIFGHDIFFLLDNGWRVLNGQRPHTDFTSAWGPVTFLLMAFGLGVSGHSVNAVGYAAALFGLCAGFWSYGLGYNRLQAVPRFLISIFLTLLACAPFALGKSPFLSSHAMVYNRFGYALIGLILIEIIEPSEHTEDQARGDWFGGFSSGAAVAVAMFLKASYFLVAVALVGLSILLRRVSRARMLGLAAGFTLITVPILSYLRFDIPAVIADLRMAAGARSASFGFSTIVARAVNNSSRLLAMLLCAAGSLLSPWSLKGVWRPGLVILLSLLVFGIDVAIMSANAQATGMPLVALFGLIVMNRIMKQSGSLTPSESRNAVPYHSAALLLTFVVFMPHFMADAAGLAWGAWNKVRPVDLPVVPFNQPHLAPLLLFDSDNQKSNGRVYTTYINDGAELLHRASRPEDKVLTLDMFSPFSYVLERRPPTGGIAAAAYNYTISSGHRPSDDKYFGNADVVMVPKRPSSDPEYYEGFRHAYEPGLHQRFVLAAESGLWFLYRRR